MAEEKKNPAVVLGLLNVIPGVINSIASIVKDKKKTKEGAAIVPALSEVAPQIAEGISISSKVVAGYGIGGIIITYAMNHDLSQRNMLIVFLAGVFLVGLTTVAKVFEK